MDGKPRWKDLSTQVKVRFVIMGAIQLSLLIAALWDIRRRSAAQIKGPKGMWVALSFVNFAGPIAYFMFGRKPTAMVPEEMRA
jgi:hypothetical protein